MFRLAVLVALAVGPAARAADPPDPLRFVPAAAQLVVKVEDPRQLAEAVAGLDAVKGARELAPVRAVLDAPTARRGFQVLAHLERELGAAWPALLDQLGGGGVVLATTFAADPAPALLVLQGTDEAAVEKAFDRLVRMLDDELARRGAKERVVRAAKPWGETARAGDGLHAARRGAAVLVSNKADGLAAALDAAANPAAAVATRKSLRAAAALLPKNPLAWLWIDFAAVKESKATKDFFDATRNDFLQTLVIGGTVDCLRRSDYVAAGLYREPTGFRLAVRLPAGRNGFPEEFALHAPPAGTPGSLPPLEPAGVLYSQSFYLDLGYYWTHRAKLVNAEMLKQFEEGEKAASKVLPGSVKLGELLAAWGSYHRLVAVNQDALPYATKPGQVLPGFGYVTTAADPKFGKALDATLRSAGLLASLQYGLKQAEVEHAGAKIVAWRFPENKPFPDDADGLRFNFEPCYAVVGDQVIAASTVEVCKKLIAEVKRTATQPGGPAVWRGTGYAAGGGDAIAGVSDPFVTDAILRGGVGIEAARKQVAALAGWLKTLGTLRIEIDTTATEYRFDVVWEYQKD